MKGLIAAGFVAVAALGLTVGCEQERTNFTVHQSVRDSLAKEGLTGIDVDVSSDKVELEGKVATEEKRKAAELAARRAAPGLRIVNKLVVDPAAAGKVNHDTGFSVQKGLRDAIDYIQNLDIRVNGKRITLTGTAADEAASDRAALRARELNPDSEIDNQIEVKK
jgi:osmotically-inducible protein OsmY